MEGYTDRRANDAFTPDELKDLEQEGYEASKKYANPEDNPYKSKIARAAWDKGWENYHTDAADAASSQKYGF